MSLYFYFVFLLLCIYYMFLLRIFTCYYVCLFLFIYFLYLHKPFTAPPHACPLALKQPAPCLPNPLLWLTSPLPFPMHGKLNSHLHVLSFSTCMPTWTAFFFHSIKTLLRQKVGDVSATSSHPHAKPCHFFH